MRRNRTFRSIHLFCLLILVCLAISHEAHCQQVAFPGTVYPSIENEVNVVQNTASVEPFFEKLYKLKTREIDVVNIIHIGDSHIQADFLTEVVRKNLQREFGNAGRGLIVPGRVAGTNEPFNIKTSSATLWNVKRIVHPANPLPIGIGGITIHTRDVGSRINISMNDPLMDYRFNVVSLFFKSDPSSFIISVTDSMRSEIGRFDPGAFGLNEDYRRISLPLYSSAIGLEMLREKESQQQATIYGLSLENGNRGVLYHTIGVNGAKYEHYNKADLFASHTKLLSPDLIIISLGTNESVEYPNLNRGFLTQVSTLIETLGRHNPGTSFILVTPPDAFQKKIKPNPGIETIRSQIIQHAVENGLAFWDMYKVNGGKDSAKEWRTAGLLRPDGIHFTRDGYAFQGKLLFDAIMKGYDDFVADRHP